MTKKENMRLTKRFPFLIPHNRWTGKISDDYDFSYTELDAMPKGWRLAFGERMCEEIEDELKSAGRLNEYRITDIKEKYGFLHWYDIGGTERMFREIIPKYEEMSKRICITCGKPATKISTGWISPYCDECSEKISHYERFVDIDGWYAEREHGMLEDEDEL